MTTINIVSFSKLRVDEVAVEFRNIILDGELLLN